jgi:hypothetical protein
MWAVYGTKFRITAGGSGSSFTVTGGFLNAATITLKRVIGRILVFFKEARKNLAFDYFSS